VTGRRPVIDLAAAIGGELGTAPAAAPVSPPSVPADGPAPRASRTPRPASSKAPRRGRPADETAAPEMDEALLGRWRWQLGATARKAVAAQARAEAALADWERLIADAKAAGVPERLMVAAAADADLDH
jgi:hypothetical protein